MMMDLLQMLPDITRLRGFRLYGGGRRFVDLWQCGGAAILGHKPVKLVHDVKNAAERGLFAPFPNAAGRRFTNALARLFPGKAFKVYADWSAVPAYRELPVWRPFCAAETGGAFRPILPFPLAPAVIACGKDRESDYPSGGFLSPFILAAATRAVYDLLAWPERGLMRFSRIKEAFNRPETQENWQPDGIYIRPVWADAGKDWPLVFRRFMDGGFLLPPNPEDPLILPGEMSPGEETALAKLFRLTTDEGGNHF
ncbi:MAG: hypothetical protein LBD86_05570 [Spirochaetaceae bacterium]|jgi:hypothetical protein|nr:hypothetical protein [Spirochaetaceae bacterium]